MGRRPEDLGGPARVHVLVEDVNLRGEVVQRLAEAGVAAIAASSNGDPELRSKVLVCDAARLPRGLAPAGPDRYVALVGEAPQDARRALAAGAAGIVFAHDLTPLAATVAAVAVGQLAVPSSLRAGVAKPTLTTREKQIMALVVLGLTNREIADRLVLAESTVKSHLFSAFRRLGVRTRKEATALILDREQGLGSGILTITR